MSSEMPLDSLRKYIILHSLHDFKSLYEREILHGALTTEEREEVGATFLHMSLKHNDLPIFLYLISSCNISPTALEPTTTLSPIAQLMIAPATPHTVDIIEKLHEFGVDFNQPDPSFSQSPLLVLLTSPMPFSANHVKILLKMMEYDCFCITPSEDCVYEYDHSLYNPVMTYNRGFSDDVTVNMPGKRDKTSGKHAKSDKIDRNDVKSDKYDKNMLKQDKADKHGKKHKSTDKFTINTDNTNNTTKHSTRDNTQHHRFLKKGHFVYHNPLLTLISNYIQPVSIQYQQILHILARFIDPPQYAISTPFNTLPASRGDDSPFPAVATINCFLLKDSRVRPYTALTNHFLCCPKLPTVQRLIDTRDAAAATLNVLPFAPNSTYAALSNTSHLSFNLPVNVLTFLAASQRVLQGNCTPADLILLSADDFPVNTAENGGSQNGQDAPILQNVNSSFNFSKKEAKKDKKDKNNLLQTTNKYNDIQYSDYQSFLKFLTSSIQNIKNIVKVDYLACYAENVFTPLEPRFHVRFTQIKYAQTTPIANSIVASTVKTSNTAGVNDDMMGYPIGFRVLLEILRHNDLYSENTVQLVLYLFLDNNFRQQWYEQCNNTSYFKKITDLLSTKNMPKLAPSYWSTSLQPATTTHATSTHAPSLNSGSSNFDDFLYNSHRDWLSIAFLSMLSLPNTSKYLEDLTIERGLFQYFLHSQEIAALQVDNISSDADTNKVQYQQKSTYAHYRAQANFPDANESTFPNTLHSGGEDWNQFYNTQYNNEFQRTSPLNKHRKGGETPQNSQYNPYTYLSHYGAQLTTTAESPTTSVPPPNPLSSNLIFPHNNTITLQSSESSELSRSTLGVDGLNAQKQHYNGQTQHQPATNALISSPSPVCLHPPAQFGTTLNHLNPYGTGFRVTTTISPPHNSAQCGQNSIKLTQNTPNTPKHGPTSLYITHITPKQSNSTQNSSHLFHQQTPHSNQLQPHQLQMLSLAHPQPPQSPINTAVINHGTPTQEASALSQKRPSSSDPRRVQPKLPGARSPLQNMSHSPLQTTMMSNMGRSSKNLPENKAIRGPTVAYISLEGDMGMDMMNYDLFRSRQANSSTFETVHSGIQRNPSVSNFTAGVTNKNKININNNYNHNNNHIPNINTNNQMNFNYDVNNSFSQPTGLPGLSFTQMQSTTPGTRQPIQRVDPTNIVILDPLYMENLLRALDVRGKFITTFYALLPSLSIPQQAFIYSNVLNTPFLKFDIPSDFTHKLNDSHIIKDSTMYYTADTMRPQYLAQRQAVQELLSTKLESSVMAQVEAQCAISALTLTPREKSVVRDYIQFLDKFAYLVLLQPQHEYTPTQSPVREYDSYFKRILTILVLAATTKDINLVHFQYLENASLFQQVPEYKKFEKVQKSTLSSFFSGFSGTGSASHHTKTPSIPGSNHSSFAVHSYHPSNAGSNPINSLSPAPMGDLSMKNSSNFAFSSHIGHRQSLYTQKSHLFSISYPNYSFNDLSEGIHVLPGNLPQPTQSVANLLTTHTHGSIGTILFSSGRHYAHNANSDDYSPKNLSKLIRTRYLALYILLCKHPCPRLSIIQDFLYNIPLFSSKKSQKYRLLSELILPLILRHSRYPPSSFAHVFMLHLNSGGLDQSYSVDPIDEGTEKIEKSDNNDPSSPVPSLPHLLKQQSQVKEKEETRNRFTRLFKSSKDKVDPNNQKKSSSLRDSPTFGRIASHQPGLPVELDDSNQSICSTISPAPSSLLTVTIPSHSDNFSIFSPSITQMQSILNQNSHTLPSQLPSSVSALLHLHTETATRAIIQHSRPLLTITDMIRSILLNLAAYDETITAKIYTSMLALDHRVLSAHSRHHIRFSLKIRHSYFLSHWFFDGCLSTAVVAQAHKDPKFPVYFDYLLTLRDTEHKTEYYDKTAAFGDDITCPLNSDPHSASRHYSYDSSQSKYKYEDMSDCEENIASPTPISNMGGEKIERHGEKIHHNREKIDKNEGNKATMSDFGYLAGGVPQKEQSKQTSIPTATPASSALTTYALPGQAPSWLTQHGMGFGPSHNTKTGQPSSSSGPITPSLRSDKGGAQIVHEDPIFRLHDPFGNHLYYYLTINKKLTFDKHHQTVVFTNHVILNQVMHTPAFLDIMCRYYHGYISNFTASVKYTKPKTQFPQRPPDDPTIPDFSPTHHIVRDSKYHFNYAYHHKTSSSQLTAKDLASLPLHVLPLLYNIDSITEQESLSQYHHHYQWHSLFPEDPHSSHHRRSSSLMPTMHTNTNCYPADSPSANMTPILMCSPHQLQSQISAQSSSHPIHSSEQVSYTPQTYQAPATPHPQFSVPASIPRHACNPPGYKLPVNNGPSPHQIIDKSQGDDLDSNLVMLYNHHKPHSGVVLQASQPDASRRSPDMRQSASLMAPSQLIPNYPTTHEFHASASSSSLVSMQGTHSSANRYIPVYSTSSTVNEAVESLRSVEYQLSHIKLGSSSLSGAMQQMITQLPKPVLAATPMELFITSELQLVFTTTNPSFVPLSNHTLHNSSRINLLTTPTTPWKYALYLSFIKLYQFSSHFWDFSPSLAKPIFKAVLTEDLTNILWAFIIAIQDKDRDTRALTSIAQLWTQKPLKWPHKFLASRLPVANDPQQQSFYSNPKRFVDLISIYNAVTLERPQEMNPMNTTGPFTVGQTSHYNTPHSAENPYSLVQELYIPYTDLNYRLKQHVNTHSDGIYDTAYLYGPPPSQSSQQPLLNHYKIASATSMQSNGSIAADPSSPQFPEPLIAQDCNAPMPPSPAPTVYTSNFSSSSSSSYRNYDPNVHAIHQAYLSTHQANVNALLLLEPYLALPQRPIYTDIDIPVDFITEQPVFNIIGLPMHILPSQGIKKYDLSPPNNESYIYHARTEQPSVPHPMVTGPNSQSPVTEDYTQLSSSDTFKTSVIQYHLHPSRIILDSIKTYLRQKPVTVYSLHPLIKSPSVKYAPPSRAPTCVSMLNMLVGFTGVPTLVSDIDDFAEEQQRTLHYAPQVQRNTAVLYNIILVLSLFGFDIFSNPSWVWSHQYLNTFSAFYNKSIYTFARQYRDIHHKARNVIDPTTSRPYPDKIEVYEHIEQEIDRDYKHNIQLHPHPEINLYLSDFSRSYFRSEFLLNFINIPLPTHALNVLEFVNYSIPNHGLWAYYGALQLHKYAEQNKSGVLALLQPFSAYLPVSGPRSALGTSIIGHSTSHHTNNHHNHEKSEKLEKNERKTSERTDSSRSHATSAHLSIPLFDDVHSSAIRPQPLFSPSWHPDFAHFHPLSLMLHFFTFYNKYAYFACKFYFYHEFHPIISPLGLSTSPIPESHDLLRPHVAEPTPLTTPSHAHGLDHPETESTTRTDTVSLVITPADTPSLQPQAGTSVARDSFNRPDYTLLGLGNTRFSGRISGRVSGAYNIPSTADSTLDGKAYSTTRARNSTMSGTKDALAFNSVNVNPTGTHFPPADKKKDLSIHPSLQPQSYTRRYNLGDVVVPEADDMVIPYLLKTYDVSSLILQCYAPMSLLTIECKEGSIVPVSRAGGSWSGVGGHSTPVANTRNVHNNAPQNVQKFAPRASVVSMMSECSSASGPTIDRDVNPYAFTPIEFDRSQPLQQHQQFYRQTYGSLYNADDPVNTGNTGASPPNPIADILSTTNPINISTVKPLPHSTSTQQTSSKSSPPTGIMGLLALFHHPSHSLAYNIEGLLSSSDHFSTESHPISSVPNHSIHTANPHVDNALNTDDRSTLGNNTSLVPALLQNVMDNNNLITDRTGGCLKYCGNNMLENTDQLSQSSTFLSTKNQPLVQKSGFPPQSSAIPGKQQHQYQQHQQCDSHVNTSNMHNVQTSAQIPHSFTQMSNQYTPASPPMQMTRIDSNRSSTIEFTTTRHQPSITTMNRFKHADFLQHHLQSADCDMPLTQESIDPAPTPLVVVNNRTGESVDTFIISNSTLSPIHGTDFTHSSGDMAALHEPGDNTGYIGLNKGFVDTITATHGNVSDNSVYHQVGVGVYRGTTQSRQINPVTHGIKKNDDSHYVGESQHLCATARPPTRKICSLLFDIDELKGNETPQSCFSAIHYKRKEIYTKHLLQNMPSTHFAHKYTPIADVMGCLLHLFSFDQQAEVQRQFKQHSIPDVHTNMNITSTSLYDYHPNDANNTGINAHNPVHMILLDPIHNIPDPIEQFVGNPECFADDTGNKQRGSPTAMVAALAHRAAVGDNNQDKLQHITTFPACFNDQQALRFYNLAHQHKQRTVLPITPDNHNNIEHNSDRKRPQIGPILRNGQFVSPYQQNQCPVRTGSYQFPPSHQPQCHGSVSKNLVATEITILERHNEWFMALVYFILQHLNADYTRAFLTNTLTYTPERVVKAFLYHSKLPTTYSVKTMVMLLDFFHFYFFYPLEQFIVHDVKTHNGIHIGEIVQLPTSTIASTLSPLDNSEKRHNKRVTCEIDDDHQLHKDSVARHYTGQDPPVKPAVLQKHTSMHHAVAADRLFESPDLLRRTSSSSQSNYPTTSPFETHQFFQQHQQVQQPHAADQIASTPSSQQDTVSAASVSTVTPNIGISSSSQYTQYSSTGTTALGNVLSGGQSNYNGINANTSLSTTPTKNPPILITGATCLQTLLSNTNLRELLFLLMCDNPRHIPHSYDLLLIALLCGIRVNDVFLTKLPLPHSITKLDHNVSNNGHRSAKSALDYYLRQLAHSDNGVHGEIDPQTEETVATISRYFSFQASLLKVTEDVEKCEINLKKAEHKLAKYQRELKEVKEREKIELKRQRRERHNFKDIGSGGVNMQGVLNVYDVSLASTGAPYNTQNPSPQHQYPSVSDHSTSGGHQTPLTAASNPTIPLPTHSPLHNPSTQPQTPLEIGASPSHLPNSSQEGGNTVAIDATDTFVLPPRHPQNRNPPPSASGSIKRDGLRLTPQSSLSEIKELLKGLDTEIASLSASVDKLKIKYEKAITERSSIDAQQRVEMDQLLVKRNFFCFLFSLWEQLDIPLQHEHVFFIKQLLFLRSFIDFPQPPFPQVITLIKQVRAPAISPTANDSKDSKGSILKEKDGKDTKGSLIKDKESQHIPTTPSTKNSGKNELHQCVGYDALLQYTFALEQYICFTDPRLVDQFRALITTYSNSFHQIHHTDRQQLAMRYILDLFQQVYWVNNISPSMYSMHAQLVAGGAHTPNNLSTMTPNFAFDVSTHTSHRDAASPLANTLSFSQSPLHSSPFKTNNKSGHHFAYDPTQSTLPDNLSVFDQISTISSHNQLMPDKHEAEIFQKYYHIMTAGIPTPSLSHDGTVVPRIHINPLTRFNYLNNTEIVKKIHKICFNFYRQQRYKTLLSFLYLYTTVPFSLFDIDPFASPFKASSNASASANISSKKGKKSSSTISLTDTTNRKELPVYNNSSLPPPNNYISKDFPIGADWGNAALLHKLTISPDNITKLIPIAQPKQINDTGEQLLPTTIATFRTTQTSSSEFWRAAGEVSQQLLSAHPASSLVFQRNPNLITNNQNCFLSSMDSVLSQTNSQTVVNTYLPPLQTFE